MSLPVPPLVERPLAPPDPTAPRAMHAALWAGVLAVTAAGLFLPDLMVGDAPQDAAMAMRMFQQDDWVHLLRNGAPYLDKPHLLFWSAAASYRAFGVHDWSYRLPSALVSLLGAWSVFRLGRRLHGAEAGRIAAVVHATSYAIVLANHDVRMDALLTGFCAFALWQLVAWLEDGRKGALLLGAAGLGLAFSAKGLVAVAVVGASLLPHALATGRARRLASLDALLGVAAFGLAILPVVLAYHAQFGMRGVSFILLGQGIERFSGGKGSASGGDPLFFFHTLLWAVLPWTPILLAGWGARIARLGRGGLRAFREEEQVTFVGPILLLLVLGLSRSKLPHYLNPLVPALAVGVGGYLVRLAREAPGALRVLARVQVAVIVLLLALAAGLCGWVFPAPEGWVIAAALAGLVPLALSLRRGVDPLQRAWVPSAVAALVVNFVLVAHFFPALSRLQPGSEFTRSALALGVDPGRTVFVDRIYQPFQVYARQVVPVVAVEALGAEVAEGRAAWALVGDEGRRRIEEAGLPARVLLSSPDCRITVISRRLLDPRTRDTACGRAWLLAMGGTGAR